MHRLFSNETETLTLYDQQKWSLSIVSAEWGATLHGKIYLIGFYSKYTTTNDVCTHIAGVSLFWFIKPTFVTSEIENLYTLYTIDKKFKWVGSFVHFNWLWYLETDMCNSKIWRIQTRHGLKRHGRLLQDQSKYLLCLLN